MQIWIFKAFLVEFLVLFLKGFLFSFLQNFEIFPILSLFFYVVLRMPKKFGYFVLILAKFRIRDFRQKDVDNGIFVQGWPIIVQNQLFFDRWIFVLLHFFCFVNEPLRSITGV